MCTAGETGGATAAFEAFALSPSVFVRVDVVFWENSGDA